MTGCVRPSQGSSRPIPSYTADLKCTLSSHLLWVPCARVEAVAETMQAHEQHRRVLFKDMLRPNERLAQ